MAQAATIETERVTATRVQANNRMAFLPKYFRNRFLQSEGWVYDYMHAFAATDYAKGNGLWHFYELSNGGFFMAPDGPERLLLHVSLNHFEGSVSTEAAGVVTCLYVLCRLANTDGADQEYFVTQYYNLLAYAADHAEAALIFAAID